MPTGPFEPGAAGIRPMPASIGRYTLRSLLGSGGFGTVYLAHDSQLLRAVAVKVPRPRQLERYEFREAFLSEAQALAKLDHPHIVPVYDVGSTDEFPCFIVSKYVAGGSLSRRLAGLDWNWQQRAELVASIADALHCAHLAGLVHRDVKPGNILIDESSHAYLADFGLAISDDDYSLSWSGGLIGTLMYMSPEQIRGEGHLIDGRADIFSLGVLMYELLTGVRPFAAANREQVIQNILERDAKPLRQRSPKVPKELERICLRALERRATQRYATAMDFAEELRAFSSAAEFNSTIAVPLQLSPRSSHPHVPASGTSATEDPKATSATEANPIAKIVPKGLRAFDYNDAEFFLEILPGPKDRFGVPDSLRFWKHRIESDDPEETFRIGLVYGPSGCGKSSLIRAGLLPLLSSKVIPVVVSATGQDTEVRIQRALLAACPEMCGATIREGLSGMLHSVRRHESLPRDPDADQPIVLLVIDQFEQWLSAHFETAESSLINALRQCDGIKLKCLFLVRNDFWMSISRVMEELDCPILQGRNSAAVELFDSRHAQKVLFAFGHAYGALPAHADELTRHQADFLKQSVEQLSEGGRVICVRLAVYSQMLRDKVWEPRLLAQFGGVDGLGARFLEETFSSTAAAPEYRHFHLPARKLLRCLLPTAGSDIRGAMLSEEKLAEVAGYDPRDAQFKRLLRLLTDDLRLLTPTDALGSQVGVESERSESRAHTRFYQLAHDYLVASLRTWLSAKQRESVPGRAQLCLEERAALWGVTHEARQLPSWSETLGILMWTQRGSWTPKQARMMDVATRLRSRQTVVVVAAVLLTCMGVILGRQHMSQLAERRTADSLVSQLFTARLSDTLTIVNEMDKHRAAADAVLSEMVADTTSEVDKQFRALLALTREPGARAERLLDICGRMESDSIDLALHRLEPMAQDISPLLIARMHQAPSPRERLRFAAMLAYLNREQPVDLGDEATELCDALLAEDARQIDCFSQYFINHHETILPRLIDVFNDTSANDAIRTAAARPLAKFAKPQLLAELLEVATPAQHFILMTEVYKVNDDIVRRLSTRIGELQAAGQADDRTSLRMANCLITLIRLAPTENVVEEQLSQQIEPSARTQVILRSHEFGVSINELLDVLESAKDDTARQALILATEPYLTKERPFGRFNAYVSHLQELESQSPHLSLRSAALWVLTRCRLAHPEIEPAGPADPDVVVGNGQDWLVNAEGQTMAVLTQIVDSAGAQNLPPRAAGQPTEDSTIQRRFSIGQTEVTRGEFLRYDPNAKFIVQGDENDDCPANRVWVVAAMKYCRWLSEQEEIEESEMCYPKIAQIDLPHLELSDEMLERTSYRLPTEAEWEIACRANSQSTWSHGESAPELVHFGWFAANSSGRLHPKASKMPNSFGIFDSHGNAAEWCHPAPGANGSCALRGGNYNVPSSQLRTRAANYHDGSPYSFTGFRIARTVSTSKESLSSP